MKVLYFHQHFSTPRGSTGTRSYEMAIKLLGRGHQVTMVCGSYGGGVTGLDMPFAFGVRRGPVDGIDVVEFDLAYSNNDSFIRRSISFLKFSIRSIGLALSEKCDLVFATSTPLTAGIPGIVARWFRGKPFVFEVRDLWPELPREMGVITNPLLLACMSALEWATYHSSTRCVGLSPGIVAGISRRGVAPDRIATIPNGCDFTLFSSPVVPWRPQGVADSDLMAVFAGTHGIANGLDAVLDAAAQLLRRDRADIKFVLIGQGKLKAGLMERARKEGLHNVVFHDPVDKRRLAGLFAAADVGLQILANVRAFYYGTSPNKFFDYLASGLPVLNNYPGWLADLIELHECGFAVPPGDSAAFADALEMAAGDRQGLKRKGLAARELANREFGREQLGNSFADWLEGALR